MSVTKSQIVVLIGVHLSRDPGTISHQIYGCRNHIINKFDVLFIGFRIVEFCRLYIIECQDIIPQTRV